MVVSESLAANGSQTVGIGGSGIGQENRRTIGISVNGGPPIGAGRCSCCLAASSHYSGPKLLIGSSHPQSTDDQQQQQHTNGRQQNNGIALSNNRNDNHKAELNISNENNNNNEQEEINSAKRISSSRRKFICARNRKQQREIDQAERDEAQIGLLLRGAESPQSIRAAVVSSRTDGGRRQSATGRPFTSPRAQLPLACEHATRTRRRPAGGSDYLSESSSRLPDNKSRDLNGISKSISHQISIPPTRHRWWAQSLPAAQIRGVPLFIALGLLLPLLHCGSIVGSSESSGQKLPGNRRVSRQLSSGTGNSWRSAPATGGYQQQQQQQNVPYKTFYVTRACEWRSNLFVPKSNDIHFAQANQQRHITDQLQQPPLSQKESSVAYETFSANNNYAASSAGQQARSQWQQQQQQQFDNSASRTMLSTDSKALILALPSVVSQSFAGYEPACSIRMIVPRNMRILAKLTSRRLTFAQQQLEQPTENFDFEQQLGQNQQQQQQQQNQHPTSSLWFNVSQNQFTETEQRIIETEGNVLAFRFLLERFANKQVPDTKFQLVLTAFQTLSENSDLNGAAQSTFPGPSSGGGGGGRPSLESNAQFICDQQRLISANLACDGFKNCQDGQDEELATCLTLRPNQSPELGSGSHGPHAGDEFAPPIRVDHHSGDAGPTGGATFDQTLEQQQQAHDSSVWARIWHYVRDTHSLAGFFLGFLLVLALLTCCSCGTYLAYVLYRRQWPRPYGARNKNRRDLAHAQEEADHLAAAQNSENAARLERSSVGAHLQQPQQQTDKPQPQPPPPRLQSILKQRPAEPPPAVPKRPSRQLPVVSASSPPSSETAGPKRGALSSSISRGQPRAGAGPQFKPTPAKRLTRPTRPAPLAHRPPETPAPGQVWRHPVGRATPSPAPAPATTSASITFAPQHGGLSSEPTTGTITTSVTGTQRITTYHYSSGTTRLSESYLQRLATEQQAQPKRQPATTGVTATPPGDPNVNYKREISSVSPQSSLI